MNSGTTYTFEAIVAALNTGLNADTLFNIFGQLTPWIITLTVAMLALFYLKRLIKGASRGKLKI